MRAIPLFLLLGLSSSSDNTQEKYHSSIGEDYIHVVKLCKTWKLKLFLFLASLEEVFSQDPGEHQIAPASLLTTLPVLGLQWSLAFKIKLTRFLNGYPRCLDMIEESGGQQPIASMMLLPNRTLHTAFQSIRGGKNSIMDNSDSLLPLEVWTQIEIAQVQDGEATKIVFFRDQALVGQIENTQPENIFGVNVYAAGARTLQTFQPGAIQEMKIRTNMSGILNLIF